MQMLPMQVTFLDKMGTDLNVVNAARVSFDKVSNELDIKDEKLINYLAKHNHWSPFAHCSASFRVKAPIFVARQLVKHQVGFSWNEVSRRYVDNEPEFYFPDSWRKRAENVKQGSSLESLPKDYMDSLAYDLCRVALEHYNTMLIQKVCPEQARMILPQNTMTEWIWTGTLYAWARMCKLRLDSHTQKETQEIAKMIDEYMKDLFPISWEVLLAN